MLGAAQLEILDGSVRPSRARAARGVRGGLARRCARPRAELERLEALAGARERELDLLEFELAEIERVAPVAGEDARAASRERERLRNLEALRGRRLGRRAGARGRGGRRRCARWPPPRRASTPRPPLDPQLEALAERARALAIEAEDLASEIRRYGEGLEAAPGRLEAVEERLAALARLERKHGGSVEAVLEHAERCRARRDELAGAEVAMEAARGRLEAARARARGARRGAQRRARGGGAGARGGRRASGSRRWRWPTRASRSR